MIRKIGSSCNTSASHRGMTRNTFSVYYTTRAHEFPSEPRGYCRLENHCSYSMEHKHSLQTRRYKVTDISASRAYLLQGVRCSGFNLAVLYIPLIERDKTHLCIVATHDKMMGLVHSNWILFVYIMSLFSRHYFVLLNTLDACWIAIDGWSNSSRYRQE